MGFGIWSCHEAPRAVWVAGGDDGRVRVVVAHEDPGLPNWLETAGHDRGTMCWRWIHAQSHPQPIATVVPLAALRAERCG